MVLGLENNYFIDNIFLNNRAIEKEEKGGLGGAIYITTDNVTALLPNFEFINNRFANNSASLFGGAIYFENCAPKFDQSNKFEWNFASNLQNDIGTNAVILSSTNRYQQRILQNKDYTPQKPIPHKIASKISKVAS